MPKEGRAQSQEVDKVGPNPSWTTSNLGGLEQRI